MNCVALIFVILMQQPQSGAAQGAVNALFGSSGSKDVIYRTTQLLIASFFILAFIITMMDYHQQQLEQKIFFADKLLADLPGNTIVPDQANIA
jgi:protein translocase SecG subunit